MFANAVKEWARRLSRTHRGAVSNAEEPGEGTEMTQENIERIGQTETQFEQDMMIAGAMSLTGKVSAKLERSQP
jgi:hypothetical protein